MTTTKNNHCGLGAVLQQGVSLCAIQATFCWKTEIHGTRSYIY